MDSKLRYCKNLIAGVLVCGNLSPNFSMADSGSGHNGGLEWSIFTEEVFEGIDREMEWIFPSFSNKILIQICMESIDAHRKRGNEGYLGPSDYEIQGFCGRLVEIYDQRRQF